MGYARPLQPENEEMECIPEKNLVVAIIERAVADAIGETGDTRADARCWLFSKAFGEGAAEWYADLCGFEFLLTSCRNTVLKNDAGTFEGSGHGCKPRAWARASRRGK